MRKKNKNDFAPTPPMGWNSYDYYDTTVNEIGRASCRERVLDRV